MLTNADIFPLISYILILICTLSAVNIYLGFNRNKRELFGRIINAFTVFVFTHAFYVLIVEIFFPGQRWVDRMMPFAFLYGPFFYFALRVLRGLSLSKVRILINVLPFFIFLAIFFTVAVTGLYNDQKLVKQLLRYHGILSMLSFLSYTLYGAFSGDGKVIQKLKGKRMIVSLGGIMLLFVSIFFFAVIVSADTLQGKVQASYVLRVTVYSCMFIVTLLIFGYQAAYLLREDVENTSPTPVPPSVSEKISLPKYEKAALGIEQLIIYESLLEDILIKEEVYLNQRLSLNMLASKMKIPAHHLTQVLSLRIKRSFYDYVNEFRVRHACLLLEKEKDLSIETIAELSGFNSKVSFNRQFKSLIGCTPSKFRATTVE